MNHDELVDVLEEMDLWPLQATGDNFYKLRCIYSESRHEKGYDRRASATVSYGLGTSWFRCFACGTKKPLHEVIGDMAMTKPGSGLYQLSLKVEKLDKQAPKAVKAFDAPDHNYGIELKQLMENEFSTPAKRLLKEKGVELDFARKVFKICFMPKGFNAASMRQPAKHDGIFFPLLIRTPENKLKCIGGQVRPLGGHLKYFYPFPNRVRGHLYGEHLASKIRGKHVFLEEGMLDVIHTWQEGHPALGALGTGFCGADALLIKRIDPLTVMIFMDGDSAGQVGAKRVQTELDQARIPWRNCVHKKDPKHLLKEVFDQFLA